MDEAVITSLQALGFSLYEARVYIGLLRHGPQNGNELSKAAGLPSSKVYSTLRRLAARGIVHFVRRGATTQYLCISPAELTHRLRKEFSEPLEYLDETLPTLAAFEPSAEVLTVSGLGAIRENGRYIVLDSQEEIYISVWPDDLGYLIDDLRSAQARGVRIFGMIYGDEIPVDAGTWLTHSYSQIVSDRIGGQMLTLVADDEEMLIAHIPLRGEASAVRSRNPVLALITREYLQHDIVVQRAQVNMGLDAWQSWWQGDPDLRTMIVSGQPVEDRAPKKKKGARR